MNSSIFMSLILDAGKELRGQRQSENLEQLVMRCCPVKEPTVRPQETKRILFKTQVRTLMFIAVCPSNGAELRFKSMKLIY